MVPVRQLHPILLCRCTSNSPPATTLFAPNVPLQAATELSENTFRRNLLLMRCGKGLVTSELVWKIVSSTPHRLGTVCRRCPLFVLCSRSFLPDLYLCRVSHGPRSTLAYGLSMRCAPVWPTASPCAVAKLIVVTNKIVSQAGSQAGIQAGQRGGTCLERQRRSRRRKCRTMAPLRHGAGRHTATGSVASSNERGASQKAHQARESPRPPVSPPPLTRAAKTSPSLRLCWRTVCRALISACSACRVPAIGLRCVLCALCAVPRRAHTAYFLPHSPNSKCIWIIQRR